MAKLLSHHDKFHVHALLGLTALLHFAFRFGYLFLYRKESFSQDFTSAALLSVHILLHVTSFQFELPRNRLWTKPMIWKEFRIHNAIFAYRHLIATGLGIWFPDWWWRNPPLSSMFCKVALVLGACKAADLATDWIGDTSKRTTNAMPYPSKVARNVEQTAKWFYAKSQFAATAIAAFGPPGLSFCSAFAIEIASFLMTLVRKGIIEARTYHIIYAASLFIMFPAMVATLHSGDGDAEVAIFRVSCAAFFGVHCRMFRGWGKYRVWLLAILGGAALAGGLASLSLAPVRFLCWPGFLWSATDTLVNFWKANRNEYLYGDAHPKGKAESSENANDHDSRAASETSETPTKFSR